MMLLREDLFKLISMVTYFFCVFEFDSCRTMPAAAAAPTSVVCNKIPGLTSSQKSMCYTRPDVVSAVGEGAKLGVQECQRQFRNHRWNCTAIGSPHVFGRVIVVGSREAAFVYSVSSAAVTYVITQWCSRGNISGCGCDQSVPMALLASGWKWGGCSVDARLAMRLSKKFLDARELEGDARSLMNLHNNHAGRKAVRQNLKKECKCHGVSGSCTMKTCWKTLPSFVQIGDTLLKSYRNSKRVVPYYGPKRSTSSRPVYLKLKKEKRSQRKPRPRDLIYLENSPNYCDADPSRGSLGTIGRQCNRTSKEIDGCDLMCCGRGYNTHQYFRNWQCNCKFHWCCYVNCAVCRDRTEDYVCK